MYTDGSFHPIGWFGSLYGEIDVTAENFQSEVSKGLWVYSGSWDISEIKNESEHIEYSMFNSEGQIIHSDTVPVLRDGSKGDKGDKGDDGENVVSYEITAPAVYKKDDLVTFSFYRLEGSTRTLTDCYYKIFKLNDGNWEFVTGQSGYDSEVDYQPQDEKIKITIYADENFSTELDTEFVDLITDGENGVSLFYEIDCPVVIKSGNKPKFEFYKNVDGKRQAKTVYFKIFKNDETTPVESNTGSSYEWPDYIRDYDGIQTITCKIYESSTSDTPLDIESCEYIKDGKTGISLHCLNDVIHLSCSPSGKLKSALNDTIKVELWKGTEKVVPSELTVSTDSSVTVTAPEELAYTSYITVTQAKGTNGTEGLITITAMYEGVSIKKEITVDAALDGKGVFNVYTRNDIISLSCKEDSTLKNAYSSKIYILPYYGDTQLKTGVTVSYNSAKSTKPAGLRFDVTEWNANTGELAITQNKGTIGSNGKLIFNVNINYEGMTASLEVSFPIVATNDGSPTEYYEISGSAAMAKDTAATYNFYLVKGSSKTDYTAYYKIRYKDITGVWHNGSSGQKNTISITPDVSAVEYEISIYSNSSYTNLLDTQTCYVITEAPQIVMLNNFQGLNTDVDGYTTGVSEVKVEFYGYVNGKLFPATPLVPMLSQSFNVKETKASTDSDSGYVVFEFYRGIYIDGYDSIPINFIMNNLKYHMSFTYAAMKDGNNEFKLSLNSDTVNIDNNVGEIFPDVIYPSIIHSTSTKQTMIDKDSYNSTVSSNDDKLKIRAFAYPDLNEVTIDYTKATKYTSTKDYYTKVKPAYARGYDANGSVNTKKCWTVSAKVGSTNKQCCMIFYKP